MDPVNRYFEADARRDTDAVVALFSTDGAVVDESETRYGHAEIRAWREGPAAKYEYTTTVAGTSTDGDEVVVRGRIDGDFPGGTAQLTWRFTVAGDLITRLEIAP